MVDIETLDRAERFIGSTRDGMTVQELANQLGADSDALAEGLSGQGRSRNLKVDVTGVWRTRTVRSNLPPQLAH